MTTGKVKARWWLSCALLALLPLACEESPGPLPGNLPPVTYLFVQGAQLDTTDYRQVLHWWGSDRDGEVVGFFIKWDGLWTPPAEMPRWAADTTWAYTTSTSDTFAVPLGGVYGERTFFVRAVDDHGAVDPLGKSQLFPLHNDLPTLQWSPRLARPDSSLPALAFAYKPKDENGLTTVRRFRWWLSQDGGPAPGALDTFEVRDTVLILQREDFERRSSTVAGRWTLAVQAVDDAQGRSNIIRHRWEVESPEADYLLIDNVASFVPGYTTEDQFYRGALESLAPGDYYVLDLERRGAFQTEEEVYPLLSLFRGVVWYGGTRNARNDDAVFANLRLAEPGIRRYLSGGGRLVVAATNAVGDTAGFTSPHTLESAPFSLEVLGITDFYRADGVEEIALERGSTLFVAPTIPGQIDSVVTSSKTLGADYLQISPEVEGLVWVPPGFLSHAVTVPVSPDQSEVPAYLGVVSSLGGGKMCVVPFLLSRANGLGNGSELGANLIRYVLVD